MIVTKPALYIYEVRLIRVGSKLRASILRASSFIPDVNLPTAFPVSSPIHDDT